MKANFKVSGQKRVINLAAQAGVRYSIIHPEKYLKSNIVGFFNILNLSTKYKVQKLFLHRLKCPYGLKENASNSENQKKDKQLSFYAATKKIGKVVYLLIVIV